MKVQLKLFAMARQACGDEVIELDLHPPATVKDLREVLLHRLPDLRPLASHLRFAVNSEYAGDETVIGESDELACIPPVSGG